MRTIALQDFESQTADPMTLAGREYRHSGRGWFRFKHALDIAHETLLRPRRPKLYLRIAEILESTPGNLAEQEPEALARHCFKADQNRRAQIYWLQACHHVAHWAE